MKRRIINVLVLTSVLQCLSVAAFTVPLPPGNIVQNPSFLLGFTNWVGLGGLVGTPTAPNGRFDLGGGYQDLPTTLGQQYRLDFYLAADLFTGPSTSISVELNGQPLLTFDTPPYSYDATVNRFTQMHWQEYTGSFTASATTTRLLFRDVNTVDFGLAAVSVVPIPEPNSLILLFGCCAAGISCKKSVFKNFLRVFRGVRR